MKYKKKCQKLQTRIEDYERMCKSDSKCSTSMKKPGAIK